MLALKFCITNETKVEIHFLLSPIHVSFPLSIHKPISLHILNTTFNLLLLSFYTITPPSISLSYFIFPSSSQFTFKNHNFTIIFQILHFSFSFPPPYPLLIRILFSYSQNSSQIPSIQFLLLFNFSNSHDFLHILFHSFFFPFSFPLFFLNPFSFLLFFCQLWTVILNLTRPTLLLVYFHSFSFLLYHFPFFIIFTSFLIHSPFIFIIHTPSLFCSIIIHSLYNHSF